MLLLKDRHINDLRGTTRRYHLNTLKIFYRRSGAAVGLSYLDYASDYFSRLIRISEERL